jgi:precorrin-2 methylase
MAMSLLQRLRQGTQEATVTPSVTAAEAEAAEAERRLKELRDSLMDRVLENLPPNAEEMAVINLRSQIETILEAAIEEQGLSVRPEERRALVERDGRRGERIRTVGATPQRPDGHLHHRQTDRKRFWWSGWEAFNGLG